MSLLLQELVSWVTSSLHWRQHDTAWIVVGVLLPDNLTRQNLCEQHDHPYSMCPYLVLFCLYGYYTFTKYFYQSLIMLTIIPHTAYMSISIILSHKGISLVEQIAAGVSVSLCIIITSAITMVLLVVCGFIYRRRTSGEWKETWFTQLT